MLGRKGAQNGGPGRLTIVWNAWKTGIFGCMFIMSKKVTVSAIRTHVDLIVRVAQMMGFILTSKYGAQWPAAIAPLDVMFNIFNSSFFQRWYQYQMYLVMYYLAFGLVALLAMLMAYGITGFIRNKFPTLAPLRILQVIGNLSAGPLYIPLLQMLLSTYQCHSTNNLFWKDAGVDCSSLGFRIQQGASALLGLSLFVLAALFAAIFYESNSLSSFPDSRAHGRADIIMLVGQAILVLVGQTFYENLSTWMVIAAVAAVGVLWFGAYFVYMPYYQHYMNCGNLAGACVFLWGVVCLTLNNYFYEEADAAVLLYCGAPMAALLGVMLGNYRAMRVLNTPANRLANAFDVELSVRYKLHKAIWGHPLERPVDAAARLGAKSSSRGTAAKASSTTKQKPEVEEGMETELADDLEDRAAQLRQLIPQALLTDIQQMYRQAAIRFRSSGFLHVFCARFYSTYLGNRHMQFSHLLQAEKRSPAMDVSYLVFQARKLAEGNSSGGAGMSAMHRVTFEKYATDARRFVLQAAQQQLAFWAELLESLPDLSRLHRLSTEINEAVMSAERSFAELYAINPQSLAVIRLYAAFNTHVTGNTDKAMALTAEADRLEDMKTKEQNAEGTTRLQFMAESSLDIMAENTAIITVGAATRNLGLISSTNAAACKLFGYGRLQLERRSAFTLLPRPLDRFHEIALKRYINTGEGSVVDYNRIIFGLHKSGAIIPVLSSVREAPSDGGPPSFIWLMRELRSQTQYFILDASNTVLGGTTGAIDMLGVDHEAIATGEIRLAAYISEWHLSQIQQELASAQGAVVKIEARVIVESDGETSPTHDGTVATTSPPRASIPDASAVRTQETWLRAFLQPVKTEDLECWVVHAQPLTAMDAITIERIEKRRVEMIEEGKAPRHVDRRNSTLSHSRPPSASYLMNRRQSGGVSSNTSASPTNQQQAANSPHPISPVPARQQTKETPPGTPSAMLPPLRMIGRQKSTRILSVEASAERQKRISNNVSVDPNQNTDVLALLHLPGTVESASSVTNSTAHPAHPPRLQLRRQSTDSPTGRPAALDPVRPEARFPKPEEAHAGVGITENNELVGRTLKTTASNEKPSSAARLVDKERGEDARSAAGSAKANAVSKSMVRLRRFLSDGSRGLLPGLWWLRLVGIQITALAIVLSITVAVIARQSFQTCLVDLEYIRKGAKRLHYKADMFYSLQDLVAHARDWRPLSQETIAERRDNIAQNASLLAQTQQDMFRMVEGTSMANQYTRRYITITEFDAPEFGTDGSYRVMNLVDGCTVFSNVMLDLSTADMTKLAMLHYPGLDYVNYNWLRNGNGHEALHNSMEVGYDAILDARGRVYETQVLVFACMTVLICVIGAGVFVPILGKIETSADNIMKQFVILPTNVRAHMHNQALGRVKTLRREFAQDEDAEMTSSDEGEDAYEDSKIDMSQHVDDESDHDQEGVDWDNLVNARQNGKFMSGRFKSVKGLVSAGSAKKMQSKTTKPYRKSSRSFFMLVLRFIGPLVSLLLMFIVIFVVFAHTLDKALVLTSIATAASYRAACTREAMVNLRHLVSLTTDWNYRRNAYWVAKEAAECMVDHVRLMGFGDNAGISGAYVGYVPALEHDRPTSGLLSAGSAATINTIMFGDTCLIIDQLRSDFNYTTCSAVGGGFLNNGLAAAADVWYSRFYRLAEYHLNVAYEKAKLVEGKGWLVPPGTLHNNTACLESERCYLRSVPMPQSGSVPPTPLSDFFFSGDVNSSETALPASANPFYIGDSLNAPEMRWLEEADRAYLTPTFFYIANLYGTEAIQTIDEFVVFLSVFTPSYMVSFLLLILFVFMPQIQLTNLDIHTKRTMLLYLPPQIVARIPSIKAMVDEILAVEIAGAGGRANASP